MPVFLICISAYTAFGQSFAIKTNPLSYIVERPSLSLEYQLNNKWSISAKTFAFIETGFLQESSQAVGIEGRYYVSGDLEGTHTGLTVGYKWQENEFSPDSGLFVSVSSGYQWIFYDWFIVDVGLSIDGSRDSDEVGIGFSSFIGVGYRF